MSVPVSGVSRVSPLSRIFKKWLGALILLPLLDCHTVAQSDEEILVNFIDPPTITRMVAERTRPDGDIFYVHMIYDRSGNFFIRAADDREDLFSDSFVRGGISFAQGKLGGFIWSIDSYGEFLATDLDEAIIEDERDEGMHESVVFRTMYNSRLGRAFLTYGVPTDYVGDVELRGNSFLFVGRDDKQEGRIEFRSGELGETEFRTTFRSERMEVPDSARSFLVEGTIDDNGIARAFEFWEMDPEGEAMRKLLGGRILEIETSEDGIADHLFLPEGHLTGGFIIISNLTERSIGRREIVDEVRPVALFGGRINPVAFVAVVGPVALLLPAMLFWLFRGGKNRVKKDDG